MAGRSEGADPESATSIAGRSENADPVLIARPINFTSASVLCLHEASRMVQEEEGVLGFEQERRGLEAWLQYYLVLSTNVRHAM